MRRPVPRDWLLLARHTATLLRGRVLRWRLETFGLYMPSYPNRRPWWRVNGRALRLLLGHRRAYRDWLRDMDALRAQGGAGWWSVHLGHGGYRAFQEYLQRQNDPLWTGEGRADG